MRACYVGTVASRGSTSAISKDDSLSTLTQSPAATIMEVAVAMNTVQARGRISHVMR